MTLPGTPETGPLTDHFFEARIYGDFESPESTAFMQGLAFFGLVASNAAVQISVVARDGHTVEFKQVRLSECTSAPVVRRMVTSSDYDYIKMRVDSSWRNPTDLIARLRQSLQDPKANIWSDTDLWYHLESAVERMAYDFAPDEEATPFELDSGDEPSLFGHAMFRALGELWLCKEGNTIDGYTLSPEEETFYEDLFEWFKRQHAWSGLYEWPAHDSPRLGGRLP